MKPLFVINIGRSGSTMLMRILSGHPNIVAHTEYPLEYPALISAIFKDEDITRRYFNACPPTLGDVHDIYQRMAHEKAKEAYYYAEKLPSWRDLNKIFELVQDARFVGIVRDPRDVLVSVKAFNRKNNSIYGFQVRDGDTESDTVNRYFDVYNKFISLVDRTGALVVRYEDIITNPTSTLIDLFQSIDLDANPKMLEGLVLQANNMEDGRHRTSSIGSIQRWRDELPAPLQEMYQEKFGKLLKMYSYPIE